VAEVVERMKITDNQYIRAQLTPFGVKCYNHYHTESKKYMIKNWPCPANEEPPIQVTYPFTWKGQIHQFMDYFGNYGGWDTQSKVLGRKCCMLNNLFEDLELSTEHQFQWDNEGIEKK
jgi:hypothetical protein